ncbi:unnamed protein product [Ilex paraguariensis]|uniref:RanBD1 domain-containing protein n=1 Tax=Ilex paraguariensis TaxID=185542 RepID=A0ABC8V5L8_9AQUA
MKGTKRFAASGSNSDYPVFQSKRIVVGSAFDGQRAEPLMEIASPPLHKERAESSRQHVRALNTQFASWVQTQLRDNPDELWEDGVQDYLSHASNIMEKFSDVVNWLKANATKGESLPALVSQPAQNKLVSEIKGNEIKSFPENTGIVSAATTASFAPSWSSGVLFTTEAAQASFSFGSQSSVPLNQNASSDVDGEGDVEQPSSPSVKKTEEKGVIVVHEVKCKLYVKSSDPADKDTWKDKGAGQLSIKCKEGVSKGTRESKPTIVVRNDVGKVLLNALLYPGIKTNVQKNSIVAIFHTSGDGGNNDAVVARTFLMRTKSEEDRNKLAAAIQEYAPAT